MADKTLQPILTEQEKENLNQKVKLSYTRVKLAEAIASLSFALLKQYGLVITQNFQISLDRNGEIIIVTDKPENLIDFLARASLQDLITLAKELEEVGKDAVISY